MSLLEVTEEGAILNSIHFLMFSFSTADQIFMSPTEWEGTYSKSRPEALTPRTGPVIALSFACSGGRIRITLSGISVSYLNHQIKEFLSTTTVYQCNLKGKMKPNLFFGTV